jgi:hypothetical protein
MARFACVWADLHNSLAVVQGVLLLLVSCDGAPSCYLLALSRGSTRVLPVYMCNGLDAWMCQAQHAQAWLNAQTCGYAVVEGSC